MDSPLFFCICAFLMLMVVSWAGYRFLYKPGRFLKQLGTPVIADAQQRLIDEAEQEPQGGADCGDGTAPNWGARAVIGRGR